jgi:hypothetical protein
MDVFVNWPHAFLLAKTQRSKERKENPLRSCLAWRTLLLGVLGALPAIGGLSSRLASPKVPTGVWVLSCENRGDFAKATKG